MLFSCSTGTYFLMLSIRLDLMPSRYEPEQIEASRARAGKQWSMAFLHPRSLGLETSFVPSLDLPPVARVLTDEWNLNSWSIGGVHFWWQ